MFSSSKASAVASSPPVRVGARPFTARLRAAPATLGVPRAMPGRGGGGDTGGTGGRGVGGGGGGGGGDGHGEVPGGGDGKRGRGRNPLFVLLATGAGAAVTHGVVAPEAQAAKARKAAEKDEELDIMEIIKSPMAENIGISFVSGACVAALLKMVARAAAIAFGLAFVSIQGLAMAGVLSVDWVTVEKRMQAFGDLNKDGKLDEKDLRILLARGQAILTEGLPSVGGFLLGFQFGLKVL